jgi:hypothetical protein
MKLFVSLWLSVVLFIATSSAQSLTPGQITDNSGAKALLTQRFVVANPPKSTIKQEVPVKTESADTTAAGPKDINFTISYNSRKNVLSGSTDSRYEKGKNRAHNKGVPAVSSFTAAPNASKLMYMNFMQMQLSVAGINTLMSISNLKFNGMDVTGSYTVDGSGEIFWHLLNTDFSNDFTVTGTIKLDNLPETTERNMVEFDFGYASNLTALPSSVSWGDINADQKNNANIINWNTIREENNDRFIVERGTDGINFAGIGLVTAAGNRTMSSYYNFTDNEYADGINYYRIKQVNTEGNANYSVVVRVANNSTALSQQAVNTGIDRNAAFKNTRGNSDGNTLVKNPDTAGLK